MIPEAQILEGFQFRLRPFREEQVSDRYIGWLNDPEVTRFLEIRFVRQNNATASSYVRSFYSGVEKYMWGIYPNHHEEMIGTITLHHVNLIHGTAEVGLLIGEKCYWGKDASTEAMNLLAQFAFETIGLRRLTGGTYATNHGMNFTFKRLGFRHEGTLRRAYLVDNDKYVDGYRWGILSEEWKRS